MRVDSVSAIATFFPTEYHFLISVFFVVLGLV